MCDPVSLTIAAVVVGAAGSAVSTYGQYTQAKATNEALSDAQDAARENALAKYSQLDVQRRQEFQSAQQEAFELQKERMANYGLLQAQQAEAGITGVSALRERLGLQVDAISDEGTVQTNWMNTNLQSYVDATSIQAEATSELYGVESQKTDLNSILIAGVGDALTSGAQGFSAGGGGGPSPDSSSSSSSSSSGGGE
jgi:hypothetical protein